MTIREIAGPVLEASAALAGRLRVDGQSVYGTGQFRGERRIDHAVTLDPALSLEGRRHNINSEVRLTARPVAGMSLMQM